MNKIIALACLLLSSPVRATFGPETLRGGAGLDFSSLGDFKAKTPPAPPVAAKPAGVAPIKAKGIRTVNVSGNLNMNGNGNVMPGSPFVRVDFSGYATITDATGRVTSNYTWFNRSVNC